MFFQERYFLTSNVYSYCSLLSDFHCWISNINSVPVAGLWPSNRLLKVFKDPWMLRRIAVHPIRMKATRSLDVSITSAIAKYVHPAVDFFSLARFATIKLATILWTGDFNGKKVF